MPTDEVLPPPQPSFCPFMPPIVMPSRHGLQGASVDIRPIPCLGPRDSIKGGGCAVYKACQEGPERIIRALFAIEETLDKGRGAQ